MSEIRILAASTQGALLEISNQAQALATGLQNAAPSEPGQPGKTNKSIDYLFGISAELAQVADQCEKFLISSVSSTAGNSGK